MFLAGREWQAENNDWTSLEMDYAARCYSFPSVLPLGLLDISSVSCVENTRLSLLCTHISDSSVRDIGPV